MTCLTSVWCWIRWWWPLDHIWSWACDMYCAADDDNEKTKCKLILFQEAHDAADWLANDLHLMIIYAPVVPTLYRRGRAAAKRAREKADAIFCAIAETELKLSWPIYFVLEINTKIIYPRSVGHKPKARLLPQLALIWLSEGRVSHYSRTRKGVGLFFSDP